MVKIPALELDRQNWKFYCAKLLEHAAMQNWLHVLAGEPDEDWEGCNALLHELLHDTVPISIYIQLRRNTAHQVFKYLAKRFRDREPIADPRAKKLVTCTNEVKHDPSAETPTSENAATGAEREDPPTKDLTRGTEDVDDRNVGRTQDPCMSSEASAEGNSAKRAEGPMAPCAATPHKTQTRPQNSLQATPRRLPIEDEPCRCEQEAAESIMTAERMNGMVEMAKPTEIIADINRTALLGREPAERASGVNKGDKTECDSQSQLQQTNFYCEESRQHDANVNSNVPKAHGLPLEGEWLVCASGEASDWNGDMNASNAAIERVVSPSKSRVAEDTPGVELEGCEGGTSG